MIDRDTIPLERRNRGPALAAPTPPDSVLYRRLIKREAERARRAGQQPAELNLDVPVRVEGRAR